ncbi:hypothetical protein XENOCAPTIV_010666 [Xenoophorus captivus]|uniref:Cadherin prodomain domain-containing protein n=1 Tax=Xenoophorus captivus TaxID=1517983 RepID=A0ABV0S874_9TELE
MFCIVLEREWCQNRICVCSVCFFAVEFDDCAGNEDVTFEVSDPSFLVDGDLNLVPHQNVEFCGPALLVHGFGAHADDVAQVDVSGLPVQSENTLRVSKITYMYVSLPHHCF